VGKEPKPTFKPKNGVPIGLFEPALCLRDRVNTLLMRATF